MDTAPALEILERLVAFDTVSARSNLALIEWIAAFLSRHGLQPVVLPDPGGAKANLLASIGPDVPGGIVLSGHTDVVPVDGQPWTADPFTLAERDDGRLVGRGTADMKGFIALVLALVPRLAAGRLRVPVHLAFSYDEEVGCLGVPGLLARIAAAVPRPAAVIVGEPTGMAVAAAHKGIYAFRTEVIGRDAHSSLPHQGANAIIAAAEVIGFIAGLAREKEAAGDPASGFDPPFTSFNVGTIAGGTALNIIARTANFIWEFRPVPGEDAEAIRARVEDFIRLEATPRLARRFPDAHIATRPLAAVPPLQAEPDGEAVALALRLTGANRPVTVPFATEAGLFRRSGIPAVVIGPGDIAQAHQPDEFITRAQLDAGAAFLDRLAAHVGA